MPRIRSIKPEFWTDSAICDMSPHARLLFIGMWNFADDWGVLADEPRQIKRLVLPDDDVDAAELVTELVSSGRVLRAQTDDGTKVLVIKHFRRHQRIEKTGKAQYGKPDELNYSPTSGFADHSGRAPGSLPEHSTMEVELELELEVEGELEGNPPPTPPKGGPSPERIAELWNETASPPLARVQALTDKRRRHVRARAASDRDESWWRGYFGAVASAKFLTGNNPRGWRATFDWAVRSEDSIVRVFEGQYARGSPSRNGSSMVHAAGEIYEMSRGGEPVDVGAVDTDSRMVGRALPELPR